MKNRKRLSNFNYQPKATQEGKRREKKEKEEEKKRKKKERKRTTNQQPYRQNCTFSRINSNFFPPAELPAGGG